MRREAAAPLVGLIPAAGFATRLGESATSKEALALGGRPLVGHLLERFALAGIDRAVLVLRNGKNDVIEAIERQPVRRVAVETVWTDATEGVPHTLDRAHDRLLGKRVALGFPDILFEPRDAFELLDQRQRETGADLVLGLFPTETPGVTDMVELDERGLPVDIVIKDPSCRLRYTWQIALWTESMTRFLNRIVALEESSATELYIGDVLRRFIKQGAREQRVHAQAVVFEHGRCLDVGSPEALELARRIEGDLSRLTSSSRDARTDDR